jgi:ribosomal protein S18 acetylase RimI-like enzyme
VGIVRRAVLDDLPAIVTLEQFFPGDRLSRRKLCYFLLKAHAEVWVYEEADAVLGNALVLYRQGTPGARLYSLVVHSTARGRGIAAALLERAEQAALGCGCLLMRLEVREDNHAAIELYQKHGYQVTGRTADYYQDHASAIRMRKELTR